MIGTEKNASNTFQRGFGKLRVIKNQTHSKQKYTTKLKSNKVFFDHFMSMLFRVNKFSGLVIG